MLYGTAEPKAWWFYGYVKKVCISIKKAIGILMFTMLGQRLCMFEQ